MFYESIEFLVFFSVCLYYDNRGSNFRGMLEIVIKVDSRVYVKIKIRIKIFLN